MTNRQGTDGLDFYNGETVTISRMEYEKMLFELSCLRRDVEWLSKSNKEWIKRDADSMKQMIKMAYSGGF